MEADPSGEAEVSVGNTDIHFVAREPAYWDGCFQVLKRSEAKDCYNIIGAEIRGNGDKIVIFSLSIRSAIWNDPEMPVTFDGQYAADDYTDTVQKWRYEVGQAMTERMKRRRDG